MVDERHVQHAGRLDIAEQVRLVAPASANPVPTTNMCSRQRAT
jgi:hypothetical protein